MGNVMGGIAEALISTAVGILVAIPAVVFYNVFQKKGADVEEQAGAMGNVVLASMKSHGEGSNGARTKREGEAVKAGKAEGRVETRAKAEA
jgi:hypothetical protein